MTLPLLDELEQKISHSFKDKSLIKTALTHSSKAAENNYERLEFLGDRVLGLVVAQILFERFSDETEGGLAKRLAVLVQGETLAEIANSFDLGSYIIFSDAERDAGGALNENILSDVFEAMIGALYLDAGFEKCRHLIEKFWGERFEQMRTPPQHPKTGVQEWAQGNGLPLPVYKIVGQQGPDHAPVFEIKLSVKGYPDAIAKGRSRQVAESEAARLFLEQIQKD